MMWKAVRMWWAVRARLSQEEGQDLAEYGLIVALIAVVAIAALRLLGTNIVRTLTSLARAI